jgi:hypothetical protein
MPLIVVSKGKRKEKEFCDAMPRGTFVKNQEVATSTLNILPSGVTIFTCIDFQGLRFLSWVAMILMSVMNRLCLFQTQTASTFMPNTTHYTTHFMKPFNRSFFKPVKSASSDACGMWIISYPRKDVLNTDTSKPLL